jgi:hypothetical protein
MIGKAKLDFAEIAVLGQVYHQKQHQNEEQHALHFGLRLPQGLAVLLGKNFKHNFIMMSRSFRLGFRPTNQDSIELSLTALLRNLSHDQKPSISRPYRQIQITIEGASL